MKKTWARKKNDKAVYLRKHMLKSKYGISEEEYDILLEAQNGVCAICKKIDPLGRLCVDHDHATGRVRGLLCKRCNTGLGLFYDSFEIVNRASSYLDR